jgi:hypothetical protein
MCFGGGGGGGIGNIIAPILGIVASIAMPYLAPALLPLEAAAIGAGIGAGSNLLGSAITGTYVDPLRLGVSAATGGAGGYLGAGGFSNISNALGLGANAAASTGAGLAGMEPAAFSGINAADAAAATAPIAASAGSTAAGATGQGFATPIDLGAVDPIYGSAGGTSAIGTPSTVPTSAYFGNAPSGGFMQTARDVLGVASLGRIAADLTGLTGGSQQRAAAPAMTAAPSMGTRYTTGQAGPYGPGGLGTVWRPDLNAYSTSYAPGYQGGGGGFSDTSKALLGEDTTMMG